jgi:hypothetical protein
MATTAKVFTSDELVNAVRDALTLPNTTATGTDTPRILTHLNIALETQLIPELLKTREEYYGRSTRQALVAGTNHYRIPHRAFMLKLRTLYWVDQSGKLKKLDPVALEELAGTSSSDSGDPAGYYVEGTDIILVPPPGTGSIQIGFFFRPGNLVLTADARQVTAVNLLTRVVTVTGGAFPASWPNQVLDVHSRLSGAEIKVWDASVTLAYPNVTFTQAIDGSVFGTRPIQVGDWVCLAGEAVVPGIPREMHGLLIDAAALRCVKGQGDQQNIQSQTTLLKSDIGGMVEQIESRNEGEPMRVKGRRGLLWAGRRR